MAFTLQIFSAVAFIATIAVNATFGADNGTVSNQYPLVITPAGAAFSIWALIYLALLAFVVQLFRLRADGVALNCLFLLSCVLNAAWIISFVREYMALQAVIILALAVVLFLLREEVAGLDGWCRIAFSLYLGWLIAACALGVSICVKYRILSFSDDSQHMLYFVCALIFAATASAALSLRFRDFVLPLPLIWALGWIIQVNRGVAWARPVVVTAYVALAALLGDVVFVGFKWGWNLGA
jgi:hypothetical protein